MVLRFFIALFLLSTIAGGAPLVLATQSGICRDGLSRSYTLIPTARINSNALLLRTTPGFMR
jgi:hypothetical protein